MPRRLSDEDEVCAVRGYFEGLTRDATVEKCGLSGGTVSKYWEDLQRKIGPEGIEAREYATKAKRLNITLGEAAENAQAVASIKAIGVSLDKMADFATGIYRASLKAKRTAETVVSVASRVLQMEKDTGFPFEEVAQKLEQDAKTLRDTRNAIKIESQTLLDTRQAVSAAVKSRGMTMENLESYAATRDWLKARGIDIDQDLARTVNLIRNAIRLGYDPDSLTQEIKAYSDLSYQISEIEKSLSLVKDQQAVAKTELEGLEAISKVKQTALADLRWVNESGFTNESIAFLKVKAGKICSARGIPPKEAVKLFFDALAGYDEIHGYVGDIKTLQGDIRTLKKIWEESESKMLAAEAREKTLNAEYDQKRKTLEAGFQKDKGEKEEAIAKLEGRAAVLIKDVRNLESATKGLDKLYGRFKRESETALLIELVTSPETVNKDPLVVLSPFLSLLFALQRYIENQKGDLFNLAKIRELIQKLSGEIQSHDSGYSKHAMVAVMKTLQDTLEPDLLRSSSSISSFVGQIVTEITREVEKSVQLPRSAEDLAKEVEALVGKVSDTASLDSIFAQGRLDFFRQIKAGKIELFIREGHSKVSQANVPDTQMAFLSARRDSFGFELCVYPGSSDGYVAYTSGDARPIPVEGFERRMAKLSEDILKGYRDRDLGREMRELAYDVLFSTKWNPKEENSKSPQTNQGSPS